jgi:hypothetical protein
MAAKSSLAGSVEDLKRLYNVETVIEYTGRNGLARALHTFPKHRDGIPIQDHTVLVTRFPPQLFSIDDDNKLLSRKEKFIYFQDLQIVIFTMTTLAHELLSREINELLSEKLKKMKCWTDMFMSGTMSQQLGNVSKKPDESWGPQRVNYHPTCVLEVGMSESLRALEVDAQYWIKSEISHVTQVITAKIYPHRQEIIFAIWRRNTSGKPEKDGEMCIEIHEGQLTVRNDRYLCIFFKELFERDPKPGSPERDVVFSARELAKIARRVWVGMGWNSRG